MGFANAAMGYYYYYYYKEAVKAAKKACNCCELGLWDMTKRNEEWKLKPLKG